MLELGIKINADKEFTDIETKIDTWLARWQKQLDKQPLTLKFDKNIGYGFDDIDKKSKKSLDSIHARITELRKEFRTLTPENMELKGDRIIAEFQQLKDEAGKYGETLDKASRQTMEATESMVGQIKELNRQWNELSVIQRQGVEGETLIRDFNELVQSAGDYSGSLKKAAEQHARMSEEDSLSEQLRKLKKDWNDLTLAQREGAEGDRIISMFRQLQDEAGKYAKSLTEVSNELRKEQADHQGTDLKKELELQWEALSIKQRRGREGREILKTYRQLTAESGVYTGSLQKVVSEERKITGEKKRQTSSFSQLKSLAMNYLSAYASVRLFKSMVTITGELEMQRVSLDAILQNVRRGEIIMENIKKLAVKSPFQIMDLVSYSKQLSAFSVPYNELFDTTKRLADVSAGLGVDMSRIILAYGQVRSASVLRGMELRQFTEAGIPLIDMLAKKFEELNGVSTSTGDIFEKIHRRQIPFEMIKDLFVDMTSEGGRFFEMQEKQAATLKGSIKNLKDSYDVMMYEVGSGMTGTLKDVVSGAKWAMENYQELLKYLYPVVAAVLTYHGVLVLISARYKAIKGMQVAKGIAKVIKGMLTLNTATIKVGNSMMAASSSSGWGALLGILVGVGVMVYQIFRDTDRLRELLDSIQNEEKSSAVLKKISFEDHMKKLRTLGEDTDAYRKQIAAINLTFKDFLSEQLLISDSLEEVEEKVKSVTTAIDAEHKKTAMDRGQDEIDKKYKKQLERASKNINDAFKNMMGIEGELDKNTKALIEVAISRFRELMAETGKGVDELGDELTAIIENVFDEDRFKNLEFTYRIVALDAKDQGAVGTVPFSEAVFKNISQYVYVLENASKATEEMYESVTGTFESSPVIRNMHKELKQQEEAWILEKERLSHEASEISDDAVRAELKRLDKEYTEKEFANKRASMQHHAFQDKLLEAEKEYLTARLALYATYGQDNTPDAVDIKERLGRELSDWNKIVDSVIGKEGGGFLRVTPTDYNVLDYIKRIREEYASTSEKVIEYTTLLNESAKDDQKYWANLKKLTEDVAKALGFSLIKETGGGGGGRKEKDLYLKYLAEDIAEYKKRYDMLKELEQGLTTKLGSIKREFEFKFTYEGQPNFEEYLKHEMKNIAERYGMKLNLDLDLVAADIKDVLGDKPFLTGLEEEGEAKASLERQIEAYEQLASMFNAIRESKFVKQQELDQLMDDYKSFATAKTDIDREYAKRRKEILEGYAPKSADTTVQELADRSKALSETLHNLKFEYEEDTARLEEAFLEKQDRVTDFVESLVDMSLNDMSKLLLQLQAKLSAESLGLAAQESTGVDVGRSQEEVLILQAQIQALVEEIKTLKAENEAGSRGEKATKNKHERAYDRWRKLNTVLSRVNSSFNEISATTKGTTKEIMDLAGGLASGTIGMISGLETMSKMASEGIQKTGEESSKAMQRAEQASVILAVLAAAYKVIVSIYNFLGKTDELSEKQIETFDSFVEVTNEMIEAQKELMQVLAGADVVAAFEKSQKMIESQTTAIREMGKAYLSSGSSTWKSSYGRRMSKDLSKYRNEFYKIGIDFDNFGYQLNGIMDLTAEQIADMKLYMPEAWALLSKEIQDYLNQIQSASQASVDVIDAQAEALTAISFDDLYDGLDDFLLAFDRDNKTVAENFEEYMMNAMLNVVKADFLSAKLKDWHALFTEYMKDGDLTLAEKERLQSMYKDIADEAANMFDNALDAAGISDSSTNLTGIAKGIGSASEESILLLAGYYDSIRFALLPFIDYMQSDFRTTLSLMSLRQSEHINHLKAIELYSKATAESTQSLLNNIVKVISPSDSKGAFALNVNT